MTAQTTSVIQGKVLDHQGGVIDGAEIKVKGPLGRESSVTSDSTGSFRFAGLPPGAYDLRVTKPGFAIQVYRQVAVPINYALTLDPVLAVSTINAEVVVSPDTPLLETSISSSGATVLPHQIEQMPINGRNYLDLLQLVPGISVSRQVDPETDGAVPILGERGGNTVFLIDGMPNSNAVDGGPAAPFDQDSISQFQVLTSGYKAEFGHGSGGVVNVVTRSGTGQWHGRVSAYHRNRAFDSSNVAGKRAPSLLRWNPSTNLGGPLMARRVFLFGSFERIRESRQLNFSFPSGIPGFLRALEEPLDKPSQLSQTRSFLRLDEQLGRHHLSQRINFSNSHVAGFQALSQATSLPSTRIDASSRHLMLGFQDTITFGNLNNPFVLNAYVQYRGEPASLRPTSPEFSPAKTLFNMFSSLATNRLDGDLGQVTFGAGFSPLQLKQQYSSAGANISKLFGDHEIKFGWEFQRARVEGVEPTNQLNQLFATVADFGEFGPVNSGVYVLATVGGSSAADSRVRIRNSYNGVFVQDDWKIARNVTLNLGVRWDRDSLFPNGGNVSPRLGVAWSPTSRTVIDASWGLFYDKFRLGVARNIPGLGGANLLRNQTLSFPRLLYGNPSILAQLFGLCVSSILTDAEIQNSGATCPGTGLALFGIDHLNGLVAAGHANIPPNAVVTLENVEALTGLDPQQFVDSASMSVGRAPGFFSWGGLGHLTMNFPVPQIFRLPITVDPGLRTPHNRTFHLGAKREITANLILQADYYHRDIRDMLGVRTSNLAFAARLPGLSGQLQPGTGSRPIHSYGPWYQGTYNGISVGFRRRMSKRFNLESFYTRAKAMDNALNSSFVSEVQTGRGAGLLGSNGPSDSFVGIPPAVTDPVTGQTNNSGPFVARNGNPVPQAGELYNGANLDHGPSDLAVDHTLLMHGAVNLPWRLELSAIFRAQSGFHFSKASLSPIDVDGDGLLNGVDFVSGRNRFVAPPFTNLDVRFSRRFSIAEKLKAQLIVEFFNFFNRANPAAVQQFQNQASPFGKPIQYLPGREGQVGLRIDF
ncbi:MAG TPA: TonB-dependent receptor [Pyrinomonadaceae bacterium]|nr:TonB-dependent receptor [Pyrinomonadaceae bacterium]